MPRHFAYLLIVVFLLPLSNAPAQNDEGSDLFYDICLSCHHVDMFEYDERSKKGWELTVYRMQQHAPFTDEEADIIVQYLGDGDMHREYFAEVEVEDFTVHRLQIINRGTSTTLMNIARRQDGAYAHPERPLLNLRRWPGTASLMFAKVMGYTAIVCLVMLIVTGLRRKALGGRFRPVHRALTILLGISVFLHVLIDLMEYGAPPILWLWFGVVSFIAAVGAHLTGYLRIASLNRFKVIHYGLGGMALVFAILHWVWAWV